MKKHLIAMLLCAIPAIQVAAADTPEMEQRIKESRAVLKAFAAELKGELKNALDKGGPLQAITVCSTVAPTIAREQSRKHGWQIGRTSLKPRNPDNAPDDWEKKVLERFESRKSAGENPRRMEHAEIIEQNGKRVFRYMKAIPTAEKPCLLCHGSHIEPDIAAALDKLYPKDQARGFKAGDIRGAFTITRPLP